MNLSDPLQQLNLLLSLVLKGRSADTRIDPFLLRKGYRILAIERKIPVGHDVRASLPSGYINSQVVPDLILYEYGGHDMLAFECKTTSFGSRPRVSQEAAPELAATQIEALEPTSPSGTVRQARTYLVLGVRGIASTMGMSAVATGSVVYVVAKGSPSLQEACLAELSDDILARGLQPAKWAVWGLCSRPDGIYIINISPDFCGNPVGECRVVSLTQDEEFSPPPHLPISPGGKPVDDEQKRDLQEMFRAALTEGVLHCTSPTRLVLQMEDFCQEVVPAWQFCGVDLRKHIRTEVRRYLDASVARWQDLGVTSHEEESTYMLAIPQGVLPRLQRQVTRGPFKEADLDKPRRTQRRLFGDPDEELSVASVRKRRRRRRHRR